MRIGENFDLVNSKGVDECFDLGRFSNDLLVSLEEGLSGVFIEFSKAFKRIFFLDSDTHDELRGEHRIGILLDFLRYL